MFMRDVVKNPKVTKNELKLFTHLAGRIVDETITNSDGTPITGEQRESLILFIVHDMSLGANKVKGVYFAQGLAVGVFITGVTTIYAVCKASKDSKEESRGR